MLRHAPLIVIANNVQFAHRQHASFDCVCSRMLLWAKAGRGQVRVNGASVDIQPGDVLLTPWRHAIAYTADCREPFFLAGIHFIPRQPPRTPLVRQIAHLPGALPELAARRHDAPWPGRRASLF